MKDCDGPPSANDDQQHQRLASSSVIGARCASNGELRPANGSLVGGGSCRRRAVSGDSTCYNGFAVNGLLTTAPRVDQPPTQPVVPATRLGFPPTADVTGAVGGPLTVPTRIQILADLANLCTFTGAILATLAMACMWKGRYGESTYHTGKRQTDC